MRRDAAFMGLVVSVLFAAVCAYVLAHFSAAGGRAAALAVLERRTVKNCVTLEGIAVRRESVVSASSAALYAAEDGARLAASGGARTGGSAVFYSAVDGYEYLSPSALEDFSAGTVQALLASEPQEYASAAGRLVEGFDWYYAALGAPGMAAPEKGEYELTFDGAEYPVTARLIAADFSGARPALLFRVTEDGADLMALRRCSAALTVSRVSGLALPPTAIERDAAGNDYVYCFALSRIERVRAEIIYSGEGFALAAENGGIREGMRILADWRDKDNDYLG